MVIDYFWVNVASLELHKGAATVTFYIDVKLNRQDKDNNYSIIDTRLNSTIVNNLAGSGYNFQLTGSAGTSGSDVWTFENETILTGQYRVDHNEDGTASSNVSAYAYNGYWGIDNWLSGNFKLPTIPRYFTKTPQITLTNTTTNSAAFDWNTSENCNGVRYYLDDATIGVDVFDGKATEGSFVVEDLISNSNHQIYIECKKTDSGLWSKSDVVDFTTSNKTSHLKINGEDKNATPYIRTNGEWKVAVPYIRINNNWEECK